MYALISWGNASKTFVNKILILQKGDLRLIYFAQAKEHAIPFFLKGKLLPLEFRCFEKVANLIYDVDSSFVPDQLIFRICSLKSLEFTLIVHVHQHLNIFMWNTLRVIFKERPFHVLMLKSGMRYQLIFQSLFFINCFFPLGHYVEIHV